MNLLKFIWLMTYGDFRVKEFGFHVKEGMKELQKCSLKSTSLWSVETTLYPPGEGAWQEEPKLTCLTLGVRCYSGRNSNFHPFQ